MTHAFAAGNYSYIRSAFQFSSGVAADPDFEIEHVRFDKLVPLADGFALIADYIEAADRPLQSLCACELRSPGAVDGAAFRAFNQHYVKTLAQWGIFDGVSDNNPVARSNVCPEIDPPAEPSFYAFSFTRPALGAQPTCVIAGSGESTGGDGPYAERLVRYRDMSPEGFREKVTFTVAEILARLTALGFGWNEVAFSGNSRPVATTCCTCATDGAGISTAVPWSGST